MRVVSTSTNQLVVTHDNSGWTRLAIVLACLLAGHAMWRLHTEGARSDAFIGSLGGAATLVLVGAFAFECSRFEFDGGNGMVVWSRRRALRSTSGHCAFAEVKAVTVERPLGDDGVTRRIVLRTAAGDVPLTVGYLPDASDAMLGLVVKLRLMLGLLIADDEPVPSSVQQLAAEGRELEAIKALREARGLSLTAAHTVVKSIARRRS